jgi:hypothetical protein
MVQVKLKGAPTAQDMAELAAIHRRLQALTTGFNPSGIGHPPLMAAIFAVRGCLVEWSGDPMAGQGANSAPSTSHAPQPGDSVPRRAHDRD